MKVAVIGFAEEGQATLRYIQKYGVRSTEYDEETGQNSVEITVCDQSSEIDVPRGANTQLGERYLQDLNRFDMIFRTPGLNPNKIITANPGMDSSKITTMTNEFFRVAPSSNIIGVTGTKGKGTTTTLIARMLEQSGEQVHVGGNIGTPALDLLPGIKENDWVVLELSSFQLFDIHHSPRVAVCLKITPDHLDWHTDMEEYVTAKSQVFAHQTESDTAVYNADNDYASRIGGKSPGQKMAYSVRQPAADIRIEDDAVYAGKQRVIDVSRIGLRGPHNRENVCAATGAAIAALRYAHGSHECDDIYVPEKLLKSLSAAIEDFTGLEHRLEFVGTKQGVSFYDDSFSTNPEPTIAAIHSFSEPQILILGGSSKGADFTELAREISDSNVKHTVIIGDEADNIASALDEVGFTDYTRGGDNMTDIVDEAVSNTQEGDVVVLSPACASFGMFKDYKDRGKQFKDTVRRVEG